MSELPSSGELLSCRTRRNQAFPLTNNFKLAASTIAAIYKDRWQIELFFKAIKQNLKVKTFLVTSEKAVNSQLWTAQTALLLLKFLQLKSGFGWSLSNLVSLLRMNLLTYKKSMGLDRQTISDRNLGAARTVAALSNLTTTWTAPISGGRFFKFVIPLERPKSIQSFSGKIYAFLFYFGQQ
jgi:hypothetical protein